MNIRREVLAKVINLEVFTIKIAFRCREIDEVIYWESAQAERNSTRSICHHAKGKVSYTPCIWERFSLVLEAYSPTCLWQLYCYHEEKQSYNEANTENNRDKISAAPWPLKTSLSSRLYLLSTLYMRWWIFLLFKPVQVNVLLPIAQSILNMIIWTIIKHIYMYIF